MLYGDFIDLTQEDTPGTPASRDATATVRGHGTGLSTDSTPESCSLAPSHNHWQALTTALSVLGNAIAGAAFLGAMFYAPHLLARLVNLF